jgi:nucleotide-binding universal stress UspA family protein
MYQHLFVPVDGSDLSLRAMASSIALARQLGARITGFVAEPDLPTSLLNGPAAGFPARVEAHEVRTDEHAYTVLGRFEQLASAAGVAFNGRHLRTPGVDHAIADEAEEAGCDMIVMVTHGRSPLGELIYGSHTKSVISRSKLPVLVLH